MAFSATDATGFRPLPLELHRFESATYGASYANTISIFYAMTRLAGLFLLLFFACPPLCRAEIFIETRIGFHGVFQLGRPFPLEIELSNSGRPAEGILDIQVWKGGVTRGGAPYPLYYRREVFLSSQGRKSVQFTVDPDFISRPVKVSFASAAGRATKELDLRRYFSPAPVLLLSSGGNALAPLSLVSTRSHRLVGISLAELPSDPRALLGVSHLIFYDPSLRDLTIFQLLALENWLTSGGTMVILGSINYALYQEPGLGRFLPVRVTGAKRVSFVPRSESQGRSPVIPDVWAQTSAVLRGQVIADADGIPVLVEARRGKGKVIYLSLDVGRPPLAQWDGLAKFLQKLLASTVTEAPLPQTQWNDSVFTQLMVSPSFIANYVPTVSLFLATVGYLAGIGCLAYWWQRKRYPGRRLLGCLTLTAAVSTVTGYSYFGRGGNIPDGVLLAASLLEDGGDGYVEAQTNLALFSTQIREYSLKLERGWMDLLPVPGRTREKTERGVMIQEGGGASRYQLPLREWDYRLYKMRFVERFPMHAEFTPSREQLLVTIDNQTSKDLTDCWLLVPGRGYALGDVVRGSSWTKSFPLAVADIPGQGTSHASETLGFRDVRFDDKTRDVLFHSSFFPRDGEGSPWRGSAAVFFGWVKDPERRARIDDPAIRNHDYALFRAIIPLGGGEEE